MHCGSVIIIARAGIAQTVYVVAPVDSKHGRMLLAYTFLQIRVDTIVISVFTRMSDYFGSV